MYHARRSASGRSANYTDGRDVSCRAYRALCIVAWAEGNLVIRVQDVEVDRVGVARSFSALRERAAGVQPEVRMKDVAEHERATMSHRGGCVHSQNRVGVNFVKC